MYTYMYVYLCMKFCVLHACTACTGTLQKPEKGLLTRQKKPK